MNSALAIAGSICSNTHIFKSDGQNIFTPHIFDACLSSQVTLANLLPNSLMVKN